jgi:hypothetical protein
MLGPESLPVLLSALLGSTGLVALASRLAQLSAPARLRKRLEASGALASSLPPGSARDALWLAHERDAYRLAAMSLLQPSTKYSNLVTGLIALAIFAIATATGLSYILVFNFFDEIFQDAFWDDTLEAVIFTLTMFGPLVFAILTTQSIILRTNRERLADQLFADGVTDVPYLRQKAVSVEPRRKETLAKPRRRGIATWLRG